jgi:hypothetical protein
MENDHVADPRVRVHPVGQDPLPHGQGREHRLAWDLVRLDHERLDQQRETDRDRDGDNQLDQRPQPARK